MLINIECHAIILTMVLATHAVIGGAFAAAAHAHPALGFCIGFGSHFLLDAIPHWDYFLESSTSSAKTGSKKEISGDFIIDKRFAFDLIKIGTDVLAGFTLVYLFLYGQVLAPAGFIWSAAFWGALGGVTPDFLQFAYYKIKRQPLTTLQRFHLWIHAKTRLDNHYVIGPLIQAALIGIVIFLAH